MSGLYRLILQKWAPPADPKTSFDGRTILITGGNSGVGFEAAVKFVSLGARKVIVGVRDIERGNRAKQQIENKTGKPEVVEVWPLDMNSYDSIKVFSVRASNHPDHIDAVLLNAGIQNKTFIPGNYGWEETLQVNVLSTALLGLLLLPKLKASQSAGRTSVLQITSSGTHANYKTSDMPQNARNLLEYYNVAANYNPRRQYGLSKLFIQLAVSDMATKVNGKRGNPDVVILGSSPGFCRSNLGRSYTGTLAWIARAIFNFFFARSTEEGARALVSGVTLGDKGHGQFWHHDGIKESAPQLDEEERTGLRNRVWFEIMVALKNSIPEDAWRMISS